MKIVRLFLAAVVIFLPASVYAAVTAITFENSAAVTVYPFQQNIQAVKINITADSPDILTSFGFTNSLSADEPASISDVKLWYQAAGGIFNPAAAVFVADLPRAAAKDWRNAALGFTVENGSALYATLDISASPVDVATIKSKLAKNGISFLSGGTYPAAVINNSGTQTVSNPGFLYVLAEGFMPVYADAGQAGVYAGKMTFWNSSASTASNITSITMQSVNHAGGVPMNGALTRITVKDAGTTYANYTGMTVSYTAAVPLTAALSIPAGGVSKTVDVYLDIAPAVNTYDLGIRVPQPADIVNSAGLAVMPYTGFVFPFATSRAMISQAVSSVNVSRQTLMPPNVTVGQRDVKPFTLRFTHPQSLTTYASCIIKGLTVTAIPSGGGTAATMFDDVDVSDGFTLFSGAPVLSAFTGEVWLPFTQNLTITAGTYREVTVLADIKTTIPSASFYMSLSKSADALASSGSSGGALAVVMVTSLTSTATTVQGQITNLGIHHTNYLPAYAAKSQTWVHAVDFVLTHPDSGNTASIEVKGITLNVEDSLGGGIVPSTVLSKVAVLDALNNTVLSYSSIPSSGTQVYLNFAVPQVLAPASNRTLKVYIDIPAAPSGTQVKLNLNAPAGVNAVDHNSGVSVAVSADSGDAFAMKTTNAQIVDAAVDVKVKHTDIMPTSVNEGQEDAGAMLLYLANTAAGIVSVEGIRFVFTDNAGLTIAANSVASNARIDVLNNTAAVYHDAPISATASTVDLVFASPIILNAASAGYVTVTARFSIADPASQNRFRVSVLSAAAVTAKDANLGTPVSAAAFGDVFPMQSGIAEIYDRAAGVTVQHTPVASGTVDKGDIGVQVMEFAFENPGNTATSGVIITGITLTAENGTGAISANTVFSRLAAYEKNNPVNVYGEITSVGVSQYLYINFANPVIVTPSASPGNVTVVVSADISGAASQTQFRLNLSNAASVAAGDANQGLYVTVTAKAPDYFPDMRSNLILLQAGTKLKVLHTDTMPLTASNGQQGIMPMTLRFANTTDQTASIKGLTLTVEDAAGLTLPPSARISAVRVVDGTGNTSISTSSIPVSGGRIYLTFTDDIYVVASSYAFAAIYADLADNTYTSNFRLNLAAATDIDWLPNTMTMEADSGDSFPDMRTGLCSVQLKPAQGQISHNDVIPTTVSTGQVDIFAEILNLYNPNVTGTADIMLTGITLTVEDDTNTAIDPTTALKRVLIKDGSNVYAYFTSMPSAAGPFYVPFNSPVYIGVSETVNARLYIDIVDTLQAGVFRINIKISGDVKFCDANSGSVIPAVAMNGDSFPMTTSSVIIQDRITDCGVSYSDLMPLTVNRGQQAVDFMRLDFENTGGLSAANMAITRLGFYVRDAADAGLIAKNALSKIVIKDALGTVYAEVVNVPDNTAFISIGLTTPITVQPGSVKQIIVAGDINPAAPAAGFKVALDKNTDVIARDSNSYEILNVYASSGSFPMKSSFTTIQDKSTALSLFAASLLPATVNKAQTDVPAMYLLFTNVQPAGYSSIGIRGVTITVESGSGTGIIPAEVLSSIKATDGGSTIYGSTSAIPSSGTMVYLPFTDDLLKLSAGTTHAVTVYADIVASTSRLNFMLDLNSAAHVSAFEKNSGDAINTITASYPLRTDLSTILSTPGIKVWHAAVPVSSVSTGQPQVVPLQMKFTNIGSLAEQVTGITVTVKDGLGADLNAQEVMSALYYTDSGYNTIAAAAVVSAGAQVYLPFSPPLTVMPQNYEEGLIIFDTAAVAANRDFYLSIAAGGVTATAPVSADAGDSFPMNSGIIALQQAASGVEVFVTDYMPPNVSTGQQGVYVMKLTVSNTAPAGSAPAVLKTINAFVLDAGGGGIPASTAVSRLVITDLVTDYLDTTAIGGIPYLSYTLSQPVTITAGGSVDLYYIVDIAQNTGTIASSFQVSINDESRLNVFDYNYSLPVLVTVTAAAGYSFPMGSSAAMIQDRAQELKISAQGVMPAVVSTDQENVAAMNLILTDEGDTLTASVMITRFNMYVLDSSNATIAASAAIKKISVTSLDGSTVFGSAQPVSGSSKVTVNLTAPIIVSAASPLTAVVKADIASTALVAQFKVGLEAVSDVYAVDANSFDTVIVSGPAPFRPSAAVIESRQPGIDLTSFSPLLPAGVTKGQANTGLMAFTIENNAPAGTADAVLTALRIFFKNSSNSAIPANTAVGGVYLLDSSGTTIASGAASINDNISLICAPRNIPAGTSLRVTLNADILGAATADNFKVLINSGADIVIQDENSGEISAMTITPSMPWDSGTAGIYDAPAVDLHVWHNSMMPTQVGRGQSKVMAMGLSIYNPGSAGTADVVLQGVTLTAYTGTGVTLTPDTLLGYIEFTDLTGTYFYGGVTPAASQAVYVPAQAVISAAASNTTTVYLKAKIAASAPETTFKLVIESAGFIDARNTPAGYVTVTAVNSDSFPMETGLATVIISTNIVRVGHVDLMPVSAVKGQPGVDALQISIRNESGVEMLVTGVTITVKARDNSLLDGSSVMSAIRIVDAEANTVVYGAGIMSASGTVYFGISFLSPAFTEKSFKVVVDVSSSADGAFYLELESDDDISTDQPVSILAASGHVFGSMQSSAVSLQQADLSGSYHSFPNPFNPDEELMKVEYYLPAASEVTVKILTLDGRPVKDLILNAPKAAGLHYEDVWNGRNGSGRSVKSGVYLCVIEVKDTSTGDIRILKKKIGVLR